jgi:hypothetical protein
LLGRQYTLGSRIYESGQLPSFVIIE